MLCNAACMLHQASTEVPSDRQYVTVKVNLHQVS